MSAERERARMVALLRRRGIGDKRVLAAMATVPRERFVPAGLESRAYDDAALGIGFEQTISQPYIVALMCELLAVEEGDRVLDVGLGSGYAAAVLATIGCDVVGIELVPELAERARSVLDELGLGVEVRVGDGRLGAPDRAPFAAISIAAAAEAVPGPLVDQLADEGRLVMPVGDRFGQRLVLLTRGGDRVRERWLAPCVFVPLVAPR